MGDPGATILVVDDDDLVRNLARAILTEQRYRVLAASSGEEALRLLDEHPEVELLFTDVVMPAMNGFTLAQKAKARRPALKVLYASGYVSSVEASNLGNHHGPLLNKPYRPKQLLAEVARVLRR
jgi:CheY-like chemotaxis protein